MAERRRAGKGRVYLVEKGKIICRKQEDKEEEELEDCGYSVALAILESRSIIPPRDSIQSESGA